MNRFWITGFLCLAAAVCRPAEPPAKGAATTRAVLVSGLGGSPAYSRLLGDWVARFHAVLTRSGVGADRIVVLTETEDPQANPPRRKATAANFRAAMREMARVLRPQDQFVLFVAGHGQVNEEAGKLCVPGTDLRASEVGELLDALPAQELIIVNAASGGADFLKSCLRSGRVILTATGYETEGTQTYFAEFFLRGFETGQADANQDRVVDLLEAYAYAARETANFYHRQYLLENPDLGRDVKPTAGKIHWLVRGKETRAVWRKLYADTDNLMARPRQPSGDEGEPAESLPANLDDEPDPAPQFGRYGPHWQNRRVLAEHARLDDNGAAKDAFFLWKPYEFQNVPKDPKPGETGYVARRTVLGRPLEEARK